MEISNHFLIVVSHITFIISFGPILISLINFKHLKRSLLPLFALFVFSILTDILNRIHMEMKINNSYIFHFFTIIEFVLISLFYSLFFKKYFNPLIINLLILIFFIVAFIDYKINGLNSIDNFSISIESIILTLYSLYLFYYILKNLLFENLLAEPIFWINTAILVYFAGNLLIFVFSSYLIQNAPKTHLLLWAIVHSFINIIYNVFLSIGFWKIKHKPIF